MNRIFAILLGTTLAVASLVAVGFHPTPTHIAYGPPAPLCPPDGSECNPGGPN